MPKLCGKITVKRLAGLAKVVPGGSGVGGGKMQEKTVTPSTAAQIVTPDGGYAGLSRVNVEATPLQDKIVAPGTGGQTVKADDGSVGLGTVTVQGAPLQSKTVTPGTEAQTITPDAGFYGLDAVEVAGDGNLQPENIVEGVTIFGVTGADNMVSLALDIINGEELDDTILAKLVYLMETKSLIEQAIEAKGVTIPDGTTFREYAGLIADITVDTGGNTGGDSGGNTGGDSGGNTGGGDNSEQGEPIAYLYNGVRLPGLPEWDKTAYPYAYVTYVRDIPRILCMSASSHYYENDSGKLCFGGNPNDGDNKNSCLAFYYYGGSSGWTFDGAGGNTFIGPGLRVIWTNFDLTLDDFEMKASEPIPVYE